MSFHEVRLFRFSFKNISELRYFQFHDKPSLPVGHFLERMVKCRLKNDTVTGCKNHGPLVESGV